MRWIATEKREKVFSIKEGNIETYCKFETIFSYKCDSCGYDTGEIVKDFNFCPMCGRKLESEEKQCK